MMKAAYEGAWQAALLGAAAALLLHCSSLSLATGEAVLTISGHKGL